jgi:putative transferase (TIGR04331 family)
MLENLTFRFKKNQNLEVWQYVQSQFPAIQLESRDVPFIERARDARVIVVDCCTQVYTEALLLKPTILYWNPNVWRMSEQVQPFLNELAEAEILFFSPEAAAAKLKAIYDNPYEWWNRPKTIAARTRFLQHFAYPALNWLEQWKQILGVDVLAMAV